MCISSTGTSARAVGTAFRCLGTKVGGISGEACWGVFVRFPQGARCAAMAGFFLQADANGCDLPQAHKRLGEGVTRRSTRSGIHPKTLPSRNCHTGTPRSVTFLPKISPLYGLDFRTAFWAACLDFQGSQWWVSRCCNGQVWWRSVWPNMHPGSAFF